MKKFKRYIFVFLFTLLFVLVFRTIRCYVVSIDNYSPETSSYMMYAPTIIGIFIGRILYSALFQVMINHKSIVIEENAGLIQFTFQLGFSKHYILHSNFETNMPNEIDFLKVNELIYNNASRQSFKRLVLLGSVDKILISNGNESLTLVNPSIINFDSLY